MVEAVHGVNRMLLDVGYLGKSELFWEFGLGSWSRIADEV